MEIKTIPRLAEMITEARASPMEGIVAGLHNVEAVHQEAKAVEGGSLYRHGCDELVVRYGKFPPSAG